MEKVVRRASECLFVANYAGIVVGGGLTFMYAAERKQSMFLQTAALHGCFTLSVYGLTFLKFRAYPYHLGVQLLLDVGNTLACLPTYLVWAKNELQSYLVKDQSLSLSISNKDLPPEALMDEISRQRDEKREAHEQ